ncbi:MAG: hypothetical protein P4L74_00340 [Candidatus Doudnabacteria bacterium]|nr:hypothetical protein [Candidatus Doudnabacteria bacterium]
MTDVLEKIIDAAIHAPSGDNCQPWKFAVKNDNQILVYIIPERDQSLYSWGNRASLLAIGAAIENAAIAGKHLGYNISVESFPSGDEPNLVAKLTLTKNDGVEQNLYSAIFTRCTNRKPYKRQPLAPELVKLFGNDFGGIQVAKLLMANDSSEIKKLAKLSSANEKILFENLLMHQFFYSHINWDAGQELHHREGFYIKTLEVPAFAMPSFKLAKHWPVLNFLNKLGFANIIASENAKTYNSCSAIGAIGLVDNSAQSYLAGGRLFEKIWLTATSHGLQLQPLTGICLLMQKLINNSARELSDTHRKLITENYGQMQNIFSLKNKTIALLFRIGYGPEPSARTLRLPPQILER